jgi:hypothetical protein
MVLDRSSSADLNRSSSADSDQISESASVLCTRARRRRRRCDRADRLGTTAEVPEGLLATIEARTRRGWRRRPRPGPAGAGPTVERSQCQFRGVRLLTDSESTLEHFRSSTLSEAPAFKFRGPLKNARPRL